MTAAPALRLTGVSRSFGGVLATSDVSFDVPEGAICALVGPNGAGKTTLFNLVTNLFAPDAGTIEFRGRTLAGFPPARIAALGLIRTFQAARVFPGLSVLDNVLVGGHRNARQTLWSSMLTLPSMRREEQALRDRASSLLDLVGLLPWRDTHALALPMGAQKLLEIVRALMARPLLLLLDEPAAGLNDTETAELAALLLAIRANGITVLLVEHNMALVMDIADQVLVLEAGKLIAAGPPEAIRRDERVIAAYLGTAPA